MAIKAFFCWLPRSGKGGRPVLDGEDGARGRLRHLLAKEDKARRRSGRSRRDGDLPARPADEPSTSAVAAAGQHGPSRSPVAPGFAAIIAYDGRRHKVDVPSAPAPLAPVLNLAEARPSLALPTSSSSSSSPAAVAAVTGSSPRSPPTPILRLVGPSPSPSARVPAATLVANYEFWDLDPDEREEDDVFWLPPTPPHLYEWLAGVEPCSPAEDDDDVGTEADEVDEAGPATALTRSAFAARCAAFVAAARCAAAAAASQQQQPRPRREPDECPRPIYHRSDRLGSPFLGPMSPPFRGPAFWCLAGGSASTSPVALSHGSSTRARGQLVVPGNCLDGDDEDDDQDEDDEEDDGPQGEPYDMPLGRIAHHLDGKRGVGDVPEHQRAIPVCLPIEGIRPARLVCPGPRSPLDTARARSLACRSPHTPPPRHLRREEEEDDDDDEDAEDDGENWDSDDDVMVKEDSDDDIF